MDSWTPFSIRQKARRALAQRLSGSDLSRFGALASHRHAQSSLPFIVLGLRNDPCRDGRHRPLPRRQADCYADTCNGRRICCGRDAFDTWHTARIAYQTRLLRVLGDRHLLGAGRHHARIHTPGTALD